MPEMVAPRALIFRLLVKGNEDSGSEIEEEPIKRLGFTSRLLCHKIKFDSYCL